MPRLTLRRRITLLTASVLGLVSCSTAATTGTTVQSGPTVGPASATSPATPTVVPDSVSIIDGIAYGLAVDHRGEEVELLLDLYLPAGNARPRPLVVFVHGGGFTAGSRSEYRAAARSWADAGWVAASVDYRLQVDEAAGHTAPAVAQAVSDLGQGIRWLIDNAATYDVDTERVVAMGGSAGGFTLLSTWLDPPPELGVEPLPSLSAIVSNGATLKVALGVLDVAREGPPVMLLQHEVDDTAGETIDDGYATCDAIVAAGGDCVAIAVPGEGHLVPLTIEGPHGADIVEFLETHLGELPAA